MMNITLYASFPDAHLAEKALAALLCLYASSLVGGMVITAIGLAAGLWF